MPSESVSRIEGDAVVLLGQVLADDDHARGVVEQLARSAVVVRAPRDASPTACRSSAVDTGPKPRTISNE